MKIAIINGPNLNLLGTREPDIYGNKTLEQINRDLTLMFPEIEFSFFQTNVEGEFINHIHNTAKNCDVFIINAAGYSHTSVAIADAIAAVKKPAIEVHLSNIFAREEYRRGSIIGSKCNGTISGFGWYSYVLAVEAAKNLLTKGNV
jgi:3-dehydroquinate dehydratase-2